MLDSGNNCFQRIISIHEKVILYYYQIKMQENVMLSWVLIELFFSFYNNMRETIFLFVYFLQEQEPSMENPILL